MAQTSSSASAALRLIDREVWIVTAAVGERRGGLVATWVAQASLDEERPVMALALATNHYTAELAAESGACALHLISPQQVELAWPFALHSGRDFDKFAHVTFKTGRSGSPILPDCLAWLDCRVFDQTTRGDRVYFWAEVLDAGGSGQGVPLREQQLMKLASPAQLEALQANRAKDIRQTAPAMSAWLASKQPVARPE